MNSLPSILLSGGSIIDLDATLLVQMGLFFVALAVLHGLVWRPLLKVFEAREEAIDGARDAAKRYEAEATGAGTEFDEKMRTIRLKAGEERDALRAEGARLETQILHSVHTEIEKQLDEADARIESEARKIRTELDQQIPTIARTIAGKLLAREVS